MAFEIIITAGIGLIASYLLYKSIKKSASGKCTGCKDVPGSNSCCPGCSVDRDK